MGEEIQAVERAVAAIRAQHSPPPEVALILGSGLGGLADEVRDATTLPYADIPGFATSTVKGHAGRLRLGRLESHSVVAMQGRFHVYEGHPLERVVFPVRVMRALGAKTLIVTNAAGGLNPAFIPGDVMLITDHINLMGTNPLIGPNEDAWGPRFPDMTHAYSLDLRRAALEAADRERLPLRQGVFVASTGPTYETRAERRFLRTIGGDACGMSTVPEVIAAVHRGMRVLGFSAITNVATGEDDQPADSHEEVVKVAAVAGERLARLVRTVLQREAL